MLVLKKVMPAGMSFPYDFGFVPSTLAGDGDPLDVLVFMDEPAVPGCVVETRVIGVVEGEDELPGGGTQRNDRVPAVALLSQQFANVSTIADLPKQMLEQVEQFFMNYPRLLSGKTFRVLGAKGPEEALRLVKEARERAARKPE